MSRAAEQLSCVAKAEKHLCDQAGPMFGRIIADIENRLDIKISEVRITMNLSEINRNWGGINCVITQADFGSRRMDAESPPVAGDAQREAGPC
jgi:hypothetical protein